MQTPRLVLVANRFPEECQTLADGLGHPEKDIVTAQTIKELRLLLQNPNIAAAIVDEELAREGRDMLKDIPTIVTVKTVGILPPGEHSDAWKREVEAHETRLIGLMAEHAYGFLREGDATGPVINDLLHYHPLLHQETGINNCLLVYREDVRLELSRLMVSMKVSAEPGDHTQRVGEITKLLLEGLGYNTNDASVMGTAAMYHDSGKPFIPQAILRKPGPLDPLEWDWMKRHPGIGSRLLKEVQQRLPPDVEEFLRIAQEISLEHHERPDGKGYPLGLLDKASMPARVACVADAYDAMRSRRTYKPEYAPPDVLRMMLQYKGTQFDEEVLSLFENPVLLGQVENIRAHNPR